MPQPQTKGGKLSDLARHVVVPSGIETTGWPAVRDRCAEFDVTFDPWQDGAGRLILAKRADGSYAASIGGVVMSIPRQVGKTFLIGAIVFALCLLNPGLTVLWTAHRLRTANETFGKMQAFARRRKVKLHVLKVVLGSGEEEIQFHNGSRILFGARERGFGRGFDDVDLEVFDEAQILTENAVDDMIPAMNTAANPLPIYIGTPPKESDPSEVFTLKRSEALSGDDEDTAYIEFSADRGCEPTDRAQWRKANPSYPDRTPDSAMLRMKKNLTAESFEREGLGIWPKVKKVEPGAINPAQWDLCAVGEVTESWLADPVCFGVDGTASGDCFTVVAAGHAGERIGLEVVKHDFGTDWLLEWAIGANERQQPKAWVFDPKSTTADTFMQAFIDAGLPVIECGFAERKLPRATSGLHDDIANHRVEYIEHPALTAAAVGATWRYVGESRLWDRRAGVALAPLVAATLARFGLIEEAAPAPVPFAVYT